MQLIDAYELTPRLEINKVTLSINDNDHIRNHTDLYSTPGEAAAAGRALLLRELAQLDRARAKIDRRAKRLKKSLAANGGDA